MYTYSDLTFDIEDATDEIKNFIAGQGETMQEKVCQEFNSEKMNEK